MTVSVELPGKLHEYVAYWAEPYDELVSRRVSPLVRSVPGLVRAGRHKWVRASNVVSVTPLAGDRVSVLLELLHGTETVFAECASGQRSSGLCAEIAAAAAAAVEDDPDVLDGLAASPLPYVRAAVAVNPHASDHARSVAVLSEP